MKIFFSHSSRDKWFVRNIIKCLPDHIKNWVDEKELLIGDDIPKGIETAIREDVDFVAIILSSSSIKSDWVRRELQWAITREKDLERKFIIPILIEDVWHQVEPTEFQSRRHLSCLDQSETQIAQAALELYEHVVKSTFGWIDEINNPRQPKRMQSGMRSLLTPGNEGMPDTQGFEIRDNEKVICVGCMIVAIPLNLKSFNLIEMAGEPVLSVDWNSPNGIVINAILRDEKNILVATIKKNVFHSYAPHDYEIKSDNHSILILDSSDRVVLYVKYLNHRSIEARGIFHHPDRPPVRVEQGRFFIGEREMRVILHGRGSGGGNWYDLKAVLSL